MKRIPITVISGFLGGGKTTLLNRLLRDPAFANTAVVVNEFGEIGVDHELIEKSDDAVVLLTNGCLCCSVKSDLVATLRDLFFRRGVAGMPMFERIAIETSGLADPTAVIEIIVGDPIVQSHYTLDGVVTVIDAINGLASLDMHETAVRQAAVADRIFISKLDLFNLGSSKVEALRARIRAVNPGAQLVDAETRAAELFRVPLESGPVDAQRISRWLGDGDADNTHKGHEHLHHGIESFAIFRKDPISQATLALLLRALSDNIGPNILRVKGILNIAEVPERPAVLQVAQTLLHDVVWLDRWPSEDRRSRIVFITMGIGRQVVEEIVALVERMAEKAKYLDTREVQA